MNREVALQQIGLVAGASEEEIAEALEQKLFEQKNDVLQKYMVPTLLIKKLKQLEQYAAAEQLLQPHSIAETPSHKSFSGTFHTQTIFLETYELHISQQKFELMQCTSFETLFGVIHQLVELQEAYMDLFKEQFNEYSEALPEEVNTREIIDSGSLLKGLKSGELSPPMIWAIEKELARISKIQKLS